MSDPARLRARPQRLTQQRVTPSLSPGLHTLELDGDRDSYLYIPRGLDPARPSPLVLMLHGAGGHGRQGISILESLADTAGLILVGPASKGATWDVLVEGYGPDVALIDRALSEVFAMCSVDPRRLAIGGFSDGASYALSLGLTNGDLFTHVIAFSPGFIAPTAAPDRPLIFISHGRDDPVLPIDACSRRIVPQLREAGYDVTYREFEGGHTIPADIAAEAVRWLLEHPHADRDSQE